MIKIVLYLLLNVILPKSYSCTCLEASIKEHIDNADGIIIGQILKVDTIYVVKSLYIEAKLSTPDSGAYTTNHLITLKVTETLKGEKQSDTIQIITGQGGGDCSYSFKLKTEYLIYSSLEDYYLIDSIDENARKFKSHPKRMLTTNDCDRTTSDIKREKDILKKFLNNINQITAYNTA